MDVVAAVAALRGRSDGGASDQVAAELATLDTRRDELAQEYASGSLDAMS